jgi:hypothetical protein
MKGTKWRETSSWFVSNHRSAFVVSGSIACSPLCVFHHLSLTICIPYTSSVSEVICLRSYDCLSGLCPVLVSSWFHLCFVFVSVFCSLCDLCVFLLSQDENHVPPRFLACILPLVSLLLSQIQMARQTIKTVWHQNMFLVIHAVLDWHGSTIASVRS